MKLIKLTDENGNTRNNTHWSPGTTCSITQENRHPQLCSSGVLHAYTDINLALLFNPRHSNYDSPKMFSVEGETVVSDWDKVGCYELTIENEIPLPEWYTDENKRREVQINFAVLCAETVLPLYEAAFPNDNRPRTAIEAVKSDSITEDIIRTAAVAAVAATAADAAATAADAVVAYSTYAAADAAARAANAVARVAAVDAAFWFNAAFDAAFWFNAAFWANTAAAYTASSNINLAAIAQKAVDMLDE